MNKPEQPENRSEKDRSVRMEHERGRLKNRLQQITILIKEALSAGVIHDYERDQQKVDNAITAVSLNEFGKFDVRNAFNRAIEIEEAMKKYFEQKTFSANANINDWQEVVDLLNSGELGPVEKL